MCAGWDPCFEYEGKTYAEMHKDEKVSSQWMAGISRQLTVEQNKISHRGKATDKLKKWLAGGEVETL